MTGYCKKSIGATKLRIAQHLNGSLQSKSASPPTNLPTVPFFSPLPKEPSKTHKKIAGQRLQKDCSPPQFRFSSAHVFSFGLAQPQQTEPNLDIVPPNRPYRSIATTLPSTALRSPGQLCCRAACRPARRTRFSSAPFPCRCRLHSSDPTVSDPPLPRSAPLPPSPIP
ncbi:hypothetical protein CDV36_015501 [Fusarium kuroshium]|uniref:Uncharacterized protein n=1 Tax=Fusarium kuroshium TaxID=2010991 RepID=A0A3M2RB26_9HYPO|nr:hypothetical protein CDV36_015501 [Fusarium kuroshium]